MSITTPSPVSQLADRADPAGAIVDFARDFSLEATRPSADEIAALHAAARPGTRVYVSAVSTRPAQDAIEAVVRLRAAGFEPVPHLAVRNFATARRPRRFPRPGHRRGRGAARAGDRRRPRSAERRLPQLDRGDRRRGLAAPRHRGDRDRRLSRWSPAHIRAGSRPVAGGQEFMSQRRPGWRCTSSPSSASTRRRS